MSGETESYELRVAGPVQRQLERLPEGTAAAIAEFMLSTLVENPYRVGGRLQRELEGLYSARRGAYRVVYEIDEGQRAVVVLRVDHRSRIYRDPLSATPAGSRTGTDGSSLSR